MESKLILSHDNLRYFIISLLHQGDLNLRVITSYKYVNVVTLQEIIVNQNKCSVYCHWGAELCIQTSAAGNRTSLWFTVSLLCAMCMFVIGNGTDIKHLKADWN